MDAGTIAQIAGQFGALGVLVGYLIYRDDKHEKWRRDFQRERLDADKDETASREKLAGSLVSLEHVIRAVLQGRGGNV